MIQKIFSFVVLFFLLAIGFAQSTKIIDVATSNQVQKIPLERVFLHFNESLLFSGEILKYKFYCFNNKTKKLSQISKIGYVALIANDGSSIFHHKLALKKGMGYSDFFIPTSVATGSYKLIAFTNGMKNGGSEVFFQSKMQIINPYEKLLKTNISTNSDSLSAIVSSVENRNTNIFEKENKTEAISMVLNKSIFNKREEVQLKIEMLDKKNTAGEYSLSVRKIDAFSSPKRKTSEAFNNVFINENIKKSQSFKGYIPELRGELISGIIMNKTSGLPAKYQRISLSLPGDNFIHKISTSNEKGEFHFNLDFRYENAEGVLQLISGNWDDFKISMYANYPQLEKVDFEVFNISKNLSDEILQRSIQNQLENAYQQVKLDSTLSLNYGNPFYRNLETNYDLDDFTRFNTIQETIVEIVDQVHTRRLSNGEKVFSILPEIGAPNTILPMVFVDGLFINRHQDIMGLNSKKIKSVSFSRKLFVLGAQNFQGILHFKTISGNFYEDFSIQHLQKIDLFQPQKPKSYYVEEYSSLTQKASIPDFRRQLLWLPNLNLTEDSTEINFFTSDLSGKYELELEGFSSFGKAVSIKTKFIVN